MSGIVHNFFPTQLTVKIIFSSGEGLEMIQNHISLFLRLNAVDKTCIKRPWYLVLPTSFRVGVIFTELNIIGVNVNYSHKAI